MNTTSILEWGLVGLIVAGGLRIVVQRSSILPENLQRLAPPAILELTTALLFAALAWRIGALPDLFAYSWLAAASVLLAAIDWSTHQLPTRVLWPTGIVTASLLAVASLINQDGGSALQAVGGMAVAFAFYATLYFGLGEGQLGGGDLRLGTLLGLALAWKGWPTLITGTLLGWIIAMLAVIALRFSRRDTSARLPLGPFLISGALVAVIS